ncbi:programmed cell death protein 2-like [Leucoraja erinacea]|uniref:programmed cell death protein 2-like n=1 Tax=Leucoraja erinaceus TaxID=7782 RepID=UPI0024583DEF|nr:programmed cell death protein 2-like [Leucoraja erinacea]
MQGGSGGGGIRTRAAPSVAATTGMNAARSPGPWPVLLGVRDAAVKEGSRCSWDTSKVGGTADPVPGVTLERPNCSLCCAPLAHLVQVYCPLEGSLYHRTVNVWACVRPECWGRSGGWKVLRSQCGETPGGSKPEKEGDPALTPTDWCEEADDWSEEGSPGAEDQGAPGAVTSGLLATRPDADMSDQTARLQALSLGDGWFPLPRSPGPGFMPFYMSVLEEGQLGGSAPLAHEQRLLHEYERREGVAVEQPLPCVGAGGAAERYERTEVRHGDAAFAKFLKRISSCPEQVLRYSWSGRPLLLSPLPACAGAAAPVCEICGAPRVFEFQLMPALVSLLQSVDATEASVEFGTVLVFTCEESCWAPGTGRPREECAVVQADPDAAAFTRLLAACAQ